MDTTEEGLNGTTSPSGAVGNPFTINSVDGSKADNKSSLGPFGGSLKGFGNPSPINPTTEDGDKPTTTGTPASGSTLFGGVSKGFAFSSSPSSAFNQASTGYSPFGGFSGTASAFALQATKGNGTSDGSAAAIKFGESLKSSGFGASPFGATSPFA